MANSELHAVACAATDDCMAVGIAWTLSPDDLNDPINPLTLHRDGSAWSIVPSPNHGPKSGRYEYLEAVACPARG
jgi:hypothetical protein